MDLNTRRKKENNNQKDRLVCKYCGKKFSHLGSHLWHKHKVLARDYKEEFGLPYNFALISQEVYEKKRDKFQERKEDFVKNLTIGGEKFRFKKGQKMPKNQYRSQYALDSAIKNLKKMNNHTWENCPACMQYQI